LAATNLLRMKSSSSARRGPLVLSEVSVAATKRAASAAAASKLLALHR